MRLRCPHRGLLWFYVLIVLRIEHGRNVPELGMVNDGELAVFVCWWAAAETEFLLSPRVSVLCIGKRRSGTAAAAKDSAQLLKP